MTKVVRVGHWVTALAFVAGAAQPAWAQRSRPTVALSPNQLFVPENGSRVFQLTIMDNAPERVFIVVGSNDPVLAPPEAFAFATVSAAQRTVTYSPPLDRSGSATFQFAVFDEEYPEDFATSPPTPSATVLVSNYPVTAVTAVPRPPTNLSATSSGGQVTFAWTPPVQGSVSDLPSYYLVEIGEAPGLTAVPAIRVPARTNSVPVTLPPGGYTFRVRPGNRLGLGPASAEGSAGHLTGPSIPGPPAGVQISLAASGLATATWQEPAFGAPPSVYVIEVGTASGLSNVGRFPVGRVFSASGTLGAGTYAVRVRGVSPAGEGLASQEVFLTIPSATCAAPAAPVLFPILRNGNIVSVPWTAPATGQAQGYRLHAGSTPGASDLAVLTLGPSSSYYQLAPGAGTYHVFVQALSNCGSPASSNIVTYVEPAPAVPGAPQGLTGSASRGTAVLAWRPPVTGSEVDDYVLEAGFSPGAAAIVVPLSGNLPGIGFSGVPSGTYFVRVRARNELGTSPASNEIVLTVP